MRFDNASGDLQLIWNMFLDFEAFTREADGDLNYFIEEWKEKMVRVQSAGCQYSELLLGLKLLEKVNLSRDSIMSIISKLGSSHPNSDNFLDHVVTNLQAESGINGSPVDNNTKKNNQSGTNEFNHKISVELDIKNNLILCPHCPFKIFDAVNYSKHYQEFHPNENQKKVLISKKDFKPDPDLLKNSDCDKSFHLKEDIEEHQKSNDDDLPLESFVQVWVGSPERCTENPKDDPLMSDEIKMEINSVIDLKSDINTVQAENESSDHMMSNSSDKFRCEICPREFTTVTNLRIHMVSHKTSVDFTCYHCGKTHETKHALKNHVRKEHSNEPNYGFKQIPCEICGQKVIQARMDKHMTKHFRDPFKCEICGKEFQEKRRLNFHMEDHRTTKDFICSLCGKRFQNRNTLYSHKTYHRRKENNKQREHQIDAVTESNLQSDTTNGQINTLDKIEGIKQEGSDSTPSDDNLSFPPERFQNRNTHYAHKTYHCRKEKNKQGEAEDVTESNLQSGTAKKQINIPDGIDRIKKEGSDSTPTDDNLSFPPENKVPCKTCGKFVIKTSMPRHRRLHMNNVFKCWICQKEFKLPQYLKYHLESHNETKDYICTYCGNAYKTRFVLRRHLKKCCKKKLSKTDNNPHTEDKFQIEKVVKSLSVDAMNTDTEEISGKYPSEIAGENIEQVVNQRETIDQSLREGEGKIHCKICGKLIAKNQMAIHIKVHRPSVPCQCDICGEVVEDRKMRWHLKTHNHQRNYKCSICQKQFKSSGHLNAHIETHNATNEYICSFCGKKYKTKGTLYAHINTHTKVKPLPCQFCDKIFYRYGARTFHIRAHHTGEKPYKCDICDERFYISTRKVEHMRKHTGEKPFSCNKCGKNYSESSSLNKHMKRVHKELKSSDL